MLFRSVLRVQWFGVTIEQRGQSGHALSTAWRTLVDVGHAAGNGLGIAFAIGVTTALTLGLGQSVQHLLCDTGHTCQIAHASSLGAMWVTRERDVSFSAPAFGGQWPCAPRVWPLRERWIWRW